VTRAVRARIGAGIVAALLLTGCAIGPNYKRPVVADPATFRGQATAEAASFADAPWWEAFQDPSLQALIQEALRRNYDVRIAAARVQEARANLRVARSDLYPSLDYGAGVSRSKITPGVAGAPGGPAPTANNFYYAAMTASWELDIWGRIRRSNEAATANLFASEEARRGVWLTLVSDLAQAYFELLALDVRLAIARDSTGAYQRTYDLFLDRFNLGVASRLETSRAQGALGDAQANIPQLESDIVAKENQISILLGTPPGPVTRGKAMYEQLVVPTVPAGLPSALLQRRPDLRQAEEQLVAANARIGVAKAEFFPKLSLTAVFGATLQTALQQLKNANIAVSRIIDVAGRDVAPANPGADNNDSPVLAQIPGAGIPVAPDGNAQLVIATSLQVQSSVEIPSLAGLTLAEAQKALEGLGLVLGKVVTKQKA